MASFPEIAWMEAYRDRVNADAELEVIGGWFTVPMSFTFGERRYVVRVECGKIAQITAAPRIDARSSFGFRAPMSVWEKFVSPNPPALYHDFFAMLMRVPEFVLEGDGLVAMQNARALQRMMNLRAVPACTPATCTPTTRYSGRSSCPSSSSWPVEPPWGAGRKVAPRAAAART